jgi:hypothetical protein
MYTYTGTLQTILTQTLKKEPLCVFESHDPHGSKVMNGMNINNELFKPCNQTDISH